jgi:hypothetical protein
MLYGTSQQQQQPPSQQGQQNAAAAQQQGQNAAGAQQDGSNSNNNAAAAAAAAYGTSNMGYPLLMQQYLLQHQQQLMAAAGGYGMPAGFAGGMPGMMHPAFGWPMSSNNHAGTADPNNQQVAARTGAPDFYADAGLLVGPWSANSAGLLNGMPQESTKGGKRFRRKAKDRPKRPLSAYNCFFKTERQRILDEIPEKKEEKADNSEKEETDDAKKGKKESSEEKADKVSSDDKASEKPAAEKDTKVAEAKRDDKGKKRPHGKIGFESLAKMIGQRWQNLSPDEVAFYKAKAEEDMVRYKSESKCILSLVMCCIPR